MRLFGWEKGAQVEPPGLQEEHAGGLSDQEGAPVMELSAQGGEPQTELSGQWGEPQIGPSGQQEEPQKLLSVLKG